MRLPEITKSDRPTVDIVSTSLQNADLTGSGYVNTDDSQEGHRQKCLHQYSL